MSNHGQTKSQVCTALLKKGYVNVHLNPRLSGVDVPDYLKTQDHVTLQIGRNMPIPIPDLCITVFAFSGTLSFKGAPYRVVVPWSVVFALTDTEQRGVVWEEDMPQSTLRAVLDERHPIHKARMQDEAERFSQAQKYIKSALDKPAGDKVINFQAAKARILAGRSRNRHLKPVS